MERLVQHLQQIANQHDLAQLHQWVCTFMLYVQSGAYPTMETVPHDPRFSLLRGLRWKGLHLMVPERALQEVPAQYLAILAVRGYLEAQARRRLTIRSILLTLLIVFTIPPLIYHLAPPTHDKVYHWMFHMLVIVPIERVWAWHRSIARRIDREIVQSTGETETFLQALTAVIKADIKRRGLDKNVADLVSRLNSLCKENGYPEVTMEELMPPPPSDDDGHKPLSRPAIDKGEFLLRHPPDEYNKVDKVRI
jgi:hypothetical protein